MAYLVTNNLHINKPNEESIVYEPHIALYLKIIPNHMIPLWCGPLSHQTGGTAQPPAKGCSPRGALSRLGKHCLTLDMVGYRGTLSRLVEAWDISPRKALTTYSHHKHCLNLVSRVPPSELP